MPILKYIINESLSKGYFSQLLKVALVKPSLKKETLDPDLFSNYRPVSNLPFLSKILEKCVQKQFLEHLKRNNLYAKFQSAYREGHSCETAIAKIVDDILMFIDNNSNVILMFLDLSAAFDTVNHSILLKRLKNKYGVKGSALDLFESYLSNRCFHVKIVKAKSNGRDLKYGVPQGSILGPILFILYTQTVETIAKRYGLEIHLFADDTQLYMYFKTETAEPKITILEKCLLEIKEWMMLNFLKLNEDKTQLLIISGKKNVDSENFAIDFCGNRIEPLDEAVNLGVYFDTSMSMEKYVKHICSRGYSTLRNLWNIAGKLSKDLRIQLVHSFILSRLDYCNISLYGINKKQMKKLQKLLNSAIRFVFNLTGKKYRDHITPYMKKLHILPVEYRIKYKVVMLTFKCLHGIAPKYLSQLIKLKVGLESLRNSNDYFLIEYPTLPKTPNGYRRFSYAAAKEWNVLSYDLRNITEMEIFKKKLKAYYYDKCFNGE